MEILRSEKFKKWAGIVLFAVFAAMFTAGYVAGEPDTVLAKAANICLECIGIG